MSDQKPKTLHDVDDEILQLSKMEDKLRETIERTPLGSEDRVTAERQLGQVVGRIYDLQTSAGELREADRMPLAQAHAIARRTIWPPAEKPKLVNFFAIEEVQAQEAAA